MGGRGDNWAGLIGFMPLSSHLWSGVNYENRYTHLWSGVNYENRYTHLYIYSQV